MNSKTQQQLFLETMVGSVQMNGKLCKVEVTECDVSNTDVEMHKFVEVKNYKKNR